MAAELAAVRAGKAEGEGLNARQLRAVELVLRGYRDKEVAGALGVARETVTRWRLHDEAFAEELAQRRRELRDTTADRVGALLDLALDALERELRGERPMAAVSAVAGGTAVPDMDKA